MRELKFRAWDKAKKKMIFTDNPFHAQIIASKIAGVSTCGYDIEIMQYTGLKDDTGRETYTKDIYEDIDGKRFMVDFSDGMFTANYPHEDRLIPLIDCLNGGKFVGIYHENSELLKGEETA